MSDVWPHVLSHLSGLYNWLTQAGAQDSSIDKVDFSHYNTLVVHDFTDGVSKTQDDPKIISAGKEFADLIINAVNKKNIFDRVSRKDETVGQNALLIDGQITEYEEGNAALRVMIGLGAGSSHFDAQVHFKDYLTNKTLGQIDVDKQSWALGGVLAGAQDTVLLIG